MTHGTQGKKNGVYMIWIEKQLRREITKRSNDAMMFIVFFCFRIKEKIEIKTDYELVAHRLRRFS